MKLVFISGPSGSGKTTLSNQIMYKINNGIVLRTDNYYKTGLMSKLLSRFIKGYFDRRISFNYKLFKKDFDFVIKNRVLIHERSYNFKQKKIKTFLNKTVNINFIIVEGIFVLYFEAIRALLEIKIYLHTPTQLRFQRRLKRDKLKRGRSLQSIEKQFKEFVQPMHKKYIEPTKEYADVILNGLDAMPNMLREIKLCVDPIIQ